MLKALRLGRALRLCDKIEAMSTTYRMNQRQIVPDFHGSHPRRWRAIQEVRKPQRFCDESGLMFTTENTESTESFSSL
ncbi:MAG: hypothetical protein CO108_05300, partial [Deltaproteobacteria bacterium CG_4_9_14_3_um_filter_63_12]